MKQCDRVSAPRIGRWRQIRGLVSALKPATDNPRSGAPAAALARGQHSGHAQLSFTTPLNRRNARSTRLLGRLPNLSQRLGVEVDEPGLEPPQLPHRASQASNPSAPNTRPTTAADRTKALDLLPIVC